MSYRVKQFMEFTGTNEYLKLLENKGFEDEDVLYHLQQIPLSEDILVEFDKFIERCNKK